MNEQAEEILLGTILKDNSILAEITLSPEHFLDLSNRKLFEGMNQAKKKGYPIDAAGLKDVLGETAFFFLGGERRLIEYENAVPSVHAFKSYEKMILNQWKLYTSRELIRTTLEEMSLENVQALIKDLAKVDEAGAADNFNLRLKLQEIYTELMTDPGKKRSGIPSGFLDIDDMTDGFRPNELIIVGARPSMGKTAFVVNLALNASTKGEAIPVVFSLESKDMEILKRMVSNIAEINGMKLKNAYHYTSDEEKDRANKAIAVIDKTGVHIDDRPRLKVADMRAKVRRIQHENPGREVIVFIDYLTKIQSAKDYNSDHQKVSEIVQDLKTMAKELNCPVVCLAQLNRGVEQRGDKKPLMSDLRESGSIEQEADVIMLLYRDEYYNETTEENRNLLEVEIAKNRDGIVGPVKLRYLKDINRIENLYHYHKEKSE